MIVAAVGELKLRALQTQALPYHTSRTQASAVVAVAAAERGVELASCAGATDAVACVDEGHQQVCLAAAESRYIEHLTSCPERPAGDSRQRMGAFAVAPCWDSAALAAGPVGADYQGKVAANSKIQAKLAAVFGPSKTTAPYLGADMTLIKVGAG
jgi:hypothetical protein